MNNNGRKISSKYLLTLIFTAIFFSVTFNSPANYSATTRFCKIITTAAPGAQGLAVGAGGTTRFSRPFRGTSYQVLSGDTARPRLPSRDTSYRNLSGDTARYSLIRVHYGRRNDTADYKISKDTMEA